MKLLISLTLSACFMITACTGCSSNPIKPIGCELEQVAATAATQGVMSVCTCSDSNVVDTFLLSKLGTYNLCAQSTKVKGVIGSVVCAPLINSVVSGGCSQIPSCSGVNPSNSQIQAAITFCQGKI